MAQTVDGRRIGGKGADGTIRPTDDDFPIARHTTTRHLSRSGSINHGRDSTARHQTMEAIRLTIDSIDQRGIRRWIRQLFALDGVVIIKKGGVVCLTLNANYPLIDRFLLALRTLLEPYGVCVRLTKT